MKYLALDIGERKVGVAGSDSGITAVPYSALEMGANFMTDLGKLMASEKPEVVVFGLPFLPSGDETKFCREIRKLAEGVKHEFGVEVDFENEIGTTQEAERK